MGPGSVLRGLIQQLIPLRWVDDRDNDRPVRLDPFGGVFVNSIHSTEHALAAEGSYFAVNHSSPGGQGVTPGVFGTPLTFGLPAVATIFGNAAALLAIYNSDFPVSQGGYGKTIYPRRITVVTEEATVPATTTAVAWGFAVDSIQRQPTANALGPILPQNVKGDIGIASVARAYFCNAASGLTLPSAGGGLRQWGGYFKFAAAVAKDVYELQFGGIDPGGLYTQAVTVAQKYVEKAPPIGIGPQQWGIFYLSMPGATTNNVTYEPQVELVER